MILGEKTKEQVRLHYDVMICPDSQLTNESIKTLIKSQKFTWLFVDEAHRYKEATTKRTQALLGEDNGTPGLIEAAQNVVFMSGTPFPNGRPIELFPLLDGAAPESIAYRDRIDFGTTFCDGKLVTRSMGAGREEHWNFTGASRLGELRQELRQRFMIRHTKKDCLKDLPPKTRKFVFLDQPDKLAKFSAQVLKEHTLEDLMGANHELGDIATYRREVGEAKVVQAFNYISELLENSDEKLVVFGHHVSVITDLARLLNRFHPIVVQGGMPAQRKAECVELFQKSKRHRVILGNMEAMGIGNTLTAAPGVIIVEPSWVPGINEQAEDRVHRMTQRQPVYIRYLVLRDSLDERMLRQVLAKEKNIQEIMS
jgi:SWI/SNF-related matrix-associated actin-dependent regulator 1 of chromatin subfamily A